MNKIIVSILLLGLSVVLAQEQVGVAKVVGTDLDTGVTGTVKFTRLNTTHVLVRVDISGISQNPDGLHGIHVHQYGDLQNLTSGGLSVGAHWQGVGAATHACPDAADTQRHEGDMGNWQATAGVINEEKVLNLLTLTGDSIIGRAVVLHNDTDNCVDVSSSGKRIGWGVIGIANNNSTTNQAANNNTFTRASCILSAAVQSGITGKIWLETSGENTRIYGYVDGLVQNSAHGFHVHVYGDITKSDGTSAGGHYNPNNVNHALPPASTRHVGDLPNLSTYDGNRAWFDYTSDLIELSGAQSVIGRAIIVHEKADDGCTQPTGNSGSRYAQCVIGVGSNDAVHWQPQNPTVNVPAPTATQCPTPSAPTAAPTRRSDASVQRVAQVLFAFVLLAMFAL